MPDKSSLKGGRIYFGKWHQRIQSKVIWIHCFEPDSRQNIKVAGEWAEETAHHVAVERQRQEGKSPRKRYSLLRQDASGLLPPTWCHILLSTTSNCQQIRDPSMNLSIN
jgi:hypothetical protein